MHRCERSILIHARTHPGIGGSQHHDRVASDASAACAAAAMETQHSAPHLPWEMVERILAHTSFWDRCGGAT